MKKIVTLLIIALMIVGCSDSKLQEAEQTESKTEETINTNMVNPMSEVANLEELNEEVHAKLNHPAVMGVDNEKFFVIKVDQIEKIGQYTFTVNDEECVFRFCDRAPYDQDISGVYIDGKTAFPSEDKKGDVEYNKYENTYLARWLNMDGQYVFSYNSETTTREDFETIVEELIEITTPDGNSQK